MHYTRFYALKARASVYTVQQYNLQVHPCRRFPFASADCKHDAQGHVCSNSSFMWGSNTDGTFGRGGAQAHKHTSTQAHTGHTGQRGSAWESNPCIPLALLIVFGFHSGNQWNTLSCYLTLEFSTTRCPCTIFSCYVTLGSRRRWKPKLTERKRDTCSFGFPGPPVHCDYSIIY